MIGSLSWHTSPGMGMTHSAIEAGAICFLLLLLAVCLVLIRERIFLPLLCLGLLSGCGATRQAQFHRGYERMGKFIDAYERGENTVNADPTMAGAALKIIHWARMKQIGLVDAEDEQ